MQDGTVWNSQMKLIQIDVHVTVIPKAVVDFPKARGLVTLFIFSLLLHVLLFVIYFDFPGVVLTVKKCSPV